MTLFQQRELRDAYVFAEKGGQALHLCRAASFVTSAAPLVFQRVAAKPDGKFAHLIDHDIERLMATARRLGVRVVKVGRAEKQGQHIDLCGKPLERAIAECSALELPLEQSSQP